MKRYYGIMYAYGKGMRPAGNQPDEVHRFFSPQERDLWVAEGPKDRTQAGYREDLLESDRRVRTAKERAEAGEEWPIKVLNW